MNPQGRGYIYFPVPLPKTETKEYMAFNETPTKGLPQQNFLPRNSSPHNQQWTKPGAHNSARGRSRGNNRSWQNKSYRTPNNHSNYKYTNRSYKNNGDNTFSKHKYLHPSFTEDPWAELEIKYKKKMNAKQSGDVPKSNAIE